MPIFLEKMNIYKNLVIKIKYCLKTGDIFLYTGNICNFNFVKRTHRKIQKIEVLYQYQFKFLYQVK